jgi:hypothetical protein
MIQTDFHRVREDGVNLYRTYSDSNMKIRCDQTGGLYSEAVNVENTPYTFTETDIPIEEEEITDTEALNIIMGRDDDETERSDEVPEEY